MKGKLRSLMITKRKTLAAEEKTKASRIITQKVLMLPEWKRAAAVCIYESFPSEVDTKMLITEAKKQGKTLVWEKADVYIVPGVTFDRAGNRLGRGRGYYDRLLVGKDIKIGLAFDVQVVDKVPHSSYDVPMSMVITEKETYAP